MPSPGSLENLTAAATYDAADQLKTKQIGGGGPTNFAYDAYGNLTTSQVLASGATAYAYDAANRLTSVDPPGASNTVAFTFGDEARLAFFTNAPHGTDPLDAFMSDTFRNASFLAPRVAERLDRLTGPVSTAP